MSKKSNKKKVIKKKQSKKRTTKKKVMRKKVAAKKSTSSMDKYMKLSQQYFDFMKENDLSQLSLDTKEYKISLSRANSVSEESFVRQKKVPSKRVNADVEEEVVKQSSFHKVKSPFVGTFYTTPSPDSSAFVKEGQRVSRGDVLGIVEAMKLMNEIEADASGVVRKVSLPTETPVEFGEVLFELELD